MATIYDVAKAAGVSPKTVSRVLNGNGPVGADTRQAVEQAMATLGYVPSNAARMMRAGCSGLVGLITGALSQKLEPMDPTGLPDLYIVQGLQQVMAGSGKTLMIADTGGAADKVPGLVRTFLQHRVEALIYVADFHKEVSLVRPESCPMVLVNCFDAAGTPAVIPDDERGQYDLVTALIRAGHTRIAHLRLPPDMEASRLRLRGHRRALADAGLGADQSLEIVAREAADHDDGSLLQGAIETLLAMDPLPSVICCGNDEMALRTYGLLRSRGLKVPEDICVAGYDNYRAIAETLYPPLTTVALPYHEMGRRAAALALSLMGGADLEISEPERVAGPVHWRSSVTDRTQHPKTVSLGRRPL